MLKKRLSKAFLSYHDNGGKLKKVLSMQLNKNWNAKERVKMKDKKEGKKRWEYEALPSISKVCLCMLVVRIWSWLWKIYTFLSSSCCWLTLPLTFSTLNRPCEVFSLRKDGLEDTIFLGPSRHITAGTIIFHIMYWSIHFGYLGHLNWSHRKKILS